MHGTGPGHHAAKLGDPQERGSPGGKPEGCRTGLADAAPGLHGQNRRRIVRFPAASHVVAAPQRCGCTLLQKWRGRHRIFRDSSRIYVEFVGKK